MKSESKNTGKVYRPEKDSEPESDLERFPARPHTRRLGEPAVTAPPARPLARQTADIHGVGDHDRGEAKDATVGERSKAGRPGTARHRQSPCTSQEGKLGRRLHDHSDKQRSPCLSACTRRPKDATATPGAVPVAHGWCSGGEGAQTGERSVAPSEASAPARRRRQFRRRSVVYGVTVLSVMPLVPRRASRSKASAGMGTRAWFTARLVTFVLTIRPNRFLI